MSEATFEATEAEAYEATGEAAYEGETAEAELVLTCSVEGIASELAHSRVTCG
jgi:hypothetical protein